MSAPSKAPFRPTPAVPPVGAIMAQRLELAAAFRLAARLGFHEGTCNHFSVMLPGHEGRYLVNPFGRHFGELRASDLLVVDGVGTVIEGDRPIEATAFFIHSCIHKARADAVCVLHTHMPYATALTMIENGRLEPCHQNALRFHDRIAYDDQYNGLALDDVEGERMVRCFGDKRVLFLANHGVIVTGRTVAEAFDGLYYVERAAQAQVLAMSTGRKLRLISEAVARRTQADFERDQALYATQHFEALKRLLDAEEPGWRE
jgi:ribulose-5-phosphate 4-epimerase/fuculose-1-phosphate aldolase